MYINKYLEKAPPDGLLLTDGPVSSMMVRLVGEENIHLNPTIPYKVTSNLNQLKTKKKSNKFNYCSCNRKKIPLYITTI